MLAIIIRIPYGDSVSHATINFVITRNVQPRSRDPRFLWRCCGISADPAKDRGFERMFPFCRDVTGNVPTKCLG